MKDALIQRIKDVIVSHSNERRHWYEVGKGVMDYLARDILSYIEVNGYLFAPVRPNQKVYIVYRKKVKEGFVTSVSFGETFTFNVYLPKVFYQQQYAESHIDELVFTTKEDAEKAVTL